MKNNYKWIFTIFFSSFILAIFFTFFSEMVISNVSFLFSVLITFIIIVLSIICDMVGVAISTVRVEPFNAMASKRISYAKTALLLIKNKDKVSSIFCDVIGDVCGVITGCSGTVIISSLVIISGFNAIFVSMVVMGLLSTLVITGKAIGKGIAIKNSVFIIKILAKFVRIFRLK